MENFNTYTEEDPNSVIVITSPTRIDWTDMQENDQAYVYKDFGVNHFNGDFEHWIDMDFGVTSNNGQFFWALTNLVDDLIDIDAASGDYLALFASMEIDARRHPYLMECDGGAVYSDTGNMNLPPGFLVPGTYWRIWRDEAVGTYGTIYCDIYSTAALRAARGSGDLDRLSVALHTSKKDFRYLFPLCSAHEASATKKSTGCVENLILFEPGGPVPLGLRSGGKH